MSSIDERPNPAWGFIGLFCLIFFGFSLVPMILISIPAGIVLSSALSGEHPRRRFVAALGLIASYYVLFFGVGSYEGVFFELTGWRLRGLYNFIMEYRPFFVKLYPAEFWQVRYFIHGSLVFSLFWGLIWRVEEDWHDIVLSLAMIPALPFKFIHDGIKKLTTSEMFDPNGSSFTVAMAMAIVLALSFVIVGVDGTPLERSFVFKENFAEFIRPWVYIGIFLYLGSRIGTLLDQDFEKDSVKGLSASGVAIGTNSKKQEIVLQSDVLNHHIHVVGASGFGKTTFLKNIIRSKIHAGEGLLFVDLKGDIETLSEIVSFLKEADREEDLEFFSISEDFLRYSSSISLFDNGNALEIKDKLMGAFVYENEYYKKRIESFLVLALRVLVELRDQKGEQFDFLSIYNLVVDPGEIKKLASKSDSEQAKRDLLILAEDERLKEDLSGLKADIETLLKTEFGELLSGGGGINLYESIQESKVVLIHLDSQRHEASAEKIGRLVLQEIKTASARIVTTTKSEERRPFTVIVDEFANLATEQFVGFLNKARSSGIGIVIAHQELSDLDRFSPVVKDQIMTNTSTLVCFLQKLPASAEMVAGIAGTQTIEKETFQTKEAGIFFRGREKSGLGSVREVEEYVIHPNLIKSLQPGECFVICKYPYSWIERIGAYNTAPQWSVTDEELLQALSRVQRQSAVIEVSKSIEAVAEETKVEDDWLS